MLGANPAYVLGSDVVGVSVDEYPVPLMLIESSALLLPDAACSAAKPYADPPDASLAKHVALAVAVKLLANQYSPGTRNVLTDSATVLLAFPEPTDWLACAKVVPGCPSLSETTPRQRVPALTVPPNRTDSVESCIGVGT